MAGDVVNLKLYFASTYVGDSFVLRNPPERKGRKRWASL